MAAPETELRRGAIHWADWSPGRGSEQAGRRPALVVQADVANRNDRYPNTVVATISRSGRDVPTHVLIDPSPANGLREISYVKCEQLLTISKERLEGSIGRLNEEEMERVDIAIKRVLALK